MNTDLTHALELFLAAKKGEGLRAKTIRNYHDHLVRFMASLPPERRFVGEVLTSDITVFLASEIERGMSNETVRARFRALDVFFNWCWDSDELGQPRSPMFNSRGKRVVKGPKKERKDPRRADLATVDALIEALPQRSWLEMRNRCILRMLRDTGVRIGELVAVKIEDVNLAERLLAIPQAKGQRPRYVRFTETLAQELKAYLLYRPPCAPEAAPFLFVGAKTSGSDDVTGPITVAGARAMLTKLCRRNDLPHINPHAIRHMFATTALNAGLRLELVSEQMGHNDPAFTRRVYAHLQTQTLQREYDEHWQ